MSSKTLLIQAIALLAFINFIYSQDLSADFYLSDQDLFNKAVNQQIGRCRIQDATQCSSCACSYYAKVLGDDGVTWLGLPDRYGTGCISSTCWGPPNTYQNYINTVTPICTNNVVTDGANMIRIGIVKGFCSEPCPPQTNSNPRPIPRRPRRPRPQKP